MHTRLHVYLAYMHTTYMYAIYMYTYQHLQAQVPSDSVHTYLAYIYTIHMYTYKHLQAQVIYLAYVYTVYMSAMPYTCIRINTCRRRYSVMRKMYSGLGRTTCLSLMCVSPEKSDGNVNSSSSFP